MEMINKKSWTEFQETGLLLFINSILHVFGWAIVVEKTETSIFAYPARTKFRGFDENSTQESYDKIGEYFKNNAAELTEEAM